VQEERKKKKEEILKGVLIHFLFIFPSSRNEIEGRDFKIPTKTESERRKEEHSH